MSHEMLHLSACIFFVKESARSYSPRLVQVNGMDTTSCKAIYGHIWTIYGPYMAILRRCVLCSGSMAKGHGHTASARWTLCQLSKTKITWILSSLFEYCVQFSHWKLSYVIRRGRVWGKVRYGKQVKYRFQVDSSKVDWALLLSKLLKL